MNGSRSVLRRGVVVGCLLVSLALPAWAAPASAPKEEPPVIRVGAEEVSSREMLHVLGMNVGGNEMALGMALYQMDRKAREEFARQLADALLLARAAEAKGIALEPAVAATLRWQRIRTLSQAYMERAAGAWDLGDQTLKRYYDAHRDQFVQAEAVHVRHILTEDEASARKALLAVLGGADFAKTAAEQSRDKATAERGGDLEWVERGQTPKAFEDLVFSLRKDAVGGPVKTDFGWHVVQVLEKRAARALSFEEAKGEVAQRLQRSYLEETLKKLRGQTPVTVDDKALMGLGGIQAAP
ncbi:peptidylprolyl isomerase [Aminomonas paucivorans]|uniref:PpiC-type peptidyl-prolyl cis-trans isomerase n=1 Tax=Aminomonas paucivorans DSM 12260 TaxID=584708 RepID=E3CVG5_9BACT|nr:peptidyl-prolyl cis-trans isomerase [Aminomonas paucivorans]EFQ23221.1 PpiC-type peptidyl-prolyl cis-trans isomerase [Aminomonas paucivorans DSM 12260]